jgi:tRNA A-37 threonylcarbamoyl transferase component Bud32
MLHDEAVLAPGTRIDQYVITGLLGRGGFGITYLARDEELRRDFALKEYFPEGLVRREGTGVRFLSGPNSESDYRWGLRKFHEEARLLAQFSHANIVGVRRVFEANDSAYMLLDFIKGRTLEAWLQGLDSPATQEELDLISVPLLSALGLVHANRTWHLDISPENVMVRSADGAPILLDFGASRFELKQHSQLLSALVFKAGYSAPEQYTANADRYGPWTDIYAFAAMLYRAIAGRRLPDAAERQLGNMGVAAMEIGRGRYREDFLKAIDWGLSILPRERPQSIAQWRRPLLERGGAVVAPALTRIATGRDPLPREPSADEQVREAGPSARAEAGSVPLWVLVASVVAAFAVGSATTFLVQGSSGPGPEARTEGPASPGKAQAGAHSAATEAARMRLLAGTGLLGDIIETRSNVGSAGECQSVCADKEACKAFEHRRAGRICYLYRSVFREHPSNDADSGRRD